MSEAILRAVRWFVLVASGIIGASAFMIYDDTGKVFNIFVGVTGFGIVYIMSYVWTEFRGKVLFVSVVAFILLSILSAFMGDIIYILFGTRMVFTSNYVLWFLTTGILGVPIMTLVFRAIDK